MGSIIGLMLTSRLARMVAAGLGILVAFGVYTADQRSKGAQKALAQVERANDAASKKAESASRKSRDPYARGMFLEYRDD